MHSIEIKILIFFSCGININKKGKPPEDADSFRKEKDKFKKYFSAKPGNQKK